jgi:hypothetical protein
VLVQRPVRGPGEEDHFVHSEGSFRVAAAVRFVFSNSVFSDMVFSDTVCSDIVRSDIVCSDVRQRQGTASVTACPH